MSNIIVTPCQQIWITAIVPVVTTNKFDCNQKINSSYDQHLI